jgi:hypothetical protein
MTINITDYPAGPGARETVISYREGTLTEAELKEIFDFVLDVFNKDRASVGAE